MADLAPEPTDQFQRWYDDWLALGVHNPESVVVSTADERGRPSSRYVLLRGVDRRGFVFYTNYRSRKGRDLAVNPYAALCFGWIELDRQVRVAGPVEPVSVEESDAYWRNRPRGSQVAASISEQSEPIAGRAELVSAWEAAEAAAGPGPVPRPSHWGGYRVIPEEVEFWQGRPNRLHDRFRYTRGPGGGWTIDRLMP